MQTLILLAPLVVRETRLVLVILPHRKGLAGGRYGLPANNRTERGAAGRSRSERRMRDAGGNTKMIAPQLQPELSFR